MKYRHIIWDWNGTILDDVDFCVFRVNEILVRFALKPISKDRHRELFRIPIQEYYQELGVDLEQCDFPTLNQQFLEFYRDNRANFKLHQGIKDLLADLSAQGLSHSILSSLPHLTLTEDLKHFKLADNFKSYIGMGEGKGGFSKIQNGRRLLDQLKEQGVLPSEVVIVGDTTHDHEVAIELGCDSLSVSYGHQSEKRLRKTGRVVVDKLHSGLFI